MYQRRMKRKATALGFVGLLTLTVGCSPADDRADAGANIEVPDHIQAALDNPERSDDARARDTGRKPGQVLAFFGVTPGMTVVEVGAGGGYYTEILSAAVGPEGRVIAQNTPSKYYQDYLKSAFEPLAARLENVEPRVADLSEMTLDDNSVDLVLVALVYHHMHYNEAEGEVLPAATKQSLGALLAALKPGGVLGVIEHAAPDGASRIDSAALHRVDEATTVADITGQGFELAEKSDLLHVASDDRTVYWYQTPHQGKTWRLVHKYVKP